MAFEIYALSCGAGQIGLSQAPGREGCFEADMRIIAAWQPALVISMTADDELVAVGSGQLAEALEMAGIGWAQFGVPDFGVPEAEGAAHWPALSTQAQQVMAVGARVLVHCRGGCGRSGMAVLRLLIEAGEGSENALARLRGVRPCAVETPGQMAWALCGG